MKENRIIELNSDVMSKQELHELIGNEGGIALIKNAKYTKKTNKLISAEVISYVKFPYTEETVDLFYRLRNELREADEIVSLVFFAEIKPKDEIFNIS